MAARSAMQSGVCIMGIPFGSGRLAQPAWASAAEPPTWSHPWIAAAARLGLGWDALRQLEAAYAASRPDQNGASPSAAGAVGYDRAGAYGVDVAQPFGPWDTGGFGAAHYPLAQPRWMSPAALASPYGNDLWYALGVRMGFDPQALQRFAASLASSPPLMDQTGASHSEPGAPAAPVPTPAASAPQWFSEADMFAPRLPDPSHDLAPPRAPLPTWETVAPAWPLHQQSTMEGRETGPSDLVRTLTGFGQGGAAPYSWSGGQAGVQPQWWRPEALRPQSPDGFTNAQAISAPVLPEQRESQGWRPTQQSTNKGRETGTSGSEWSALGFDTDDPLVPAASKGRWPLPPTFPELLRRWFPEQKQPTGEQKRPPSEQPRQPPIPPPPEPTATRPETEGPLSPPPARTLPVDRGFDSTNLYDKLHRYVLDPEHPQNQGKGIWFQEALGFDKHKWEDLATQLYFDESKAVVTRTTPYGTRYEQVIPITGINGRTIEVPFVFQKDSTGQVTFITVPRIPRRK
jgi:hypothetical protein